MKNLRNYYLSLLNPHSTPLAPKFKFGAVHSNSPRVFPPTPPYTQPSSTAYPLPADVSANVTTHSQPLFASSRAPPRAACCCVLVVFVGRSPVSRARASLKVSTQHVHIYIYIYAQTVRRRVALSFSLPFLSFSPAPHLIVLLRNHHRTRV